MSDTNDGDDDEQQEVAAPAPPRSAVPSGGAGFVWGGNRSARADDQAPDAPTPQSSDEPSASEQRTVPDEPTAKPSRLFPPPPVIAARPEPEPSPETAVDTDSPIPTMEEVLDAPSPRRAAREAAAREAVAREAAPDAARTDPQSMPSGLTAQPRDTGVAGPASRDAGTDGRNAGSDDSDVGSGGREAGTDSPTTNTADGAVGIESLFGDTGSEPPRASVVASGPLMDVPASEWAASLRSASTTSEAAPSPEQTPAPRTPMTAMQKRLFWVLAAVIVVALAVLVVLLTTQQAGAAVPVTEKTWAFALLSRVTDSVAGAAQSMSTS